MGAARAVVDVMDLTWFGWVYLSFVVLGAMVSVSQIGKQRKPLEPDTVIVILIIHALQLWGLFAVGFTR